MAWMKRRGYNLGPCMGYRIDNLDFPTECHKVLDIGSMSGKSSCCKRKLQRKNGQRRRSGAGGKGVRDKGRGGNGFSGLHWCSEEADTMHSQGIPDRTY